MSKFKKGDVVRQVVTPIQGTVVGYVMDPETGETDARVVWSDADGDHERTFKDAEAEVVQPDPAADEK